MFGKFTAAIAAAFMFATAGLASAAPYASNDTFARYPRHSEQYCYLPSDPCDNEHRVEN
jgi:hypothetical protein